MLCYLVPFISCIIVFWIPVIKNGIAIDLHFFLVPVVLHQVTWCVEEWFNSVVQGKEVILDAISIALMLFGVLELSNVLVLYLAPGSKRGNSVGFFDAYEKSKSDPEIHALVTYLVNWVAGTKLIFIVLLIGIIITGNAATKVFSIIALIFSILTFFSRLYPGIRSMDQAGQITPHGYSRTLGIMIVCFVVFFFIALVVYLVAS
ncbi:MAG: hypothetical protein CVV48_09545 [Spirochaetae bacterium HGW-Spirochaetae-4]|nr:MAG: hypothetical protein CVV48_09545 [Spirochaetae bacterium HGW-Spirochaetae-4]